MDDPANSTTTPPEPFWHTENVAEPVTTPTPTPPPPPATPVIPLTPDPIIIPEPPIIPTPTVDPMPPPPPPEPMMTTVPPPPEPVVAVKPKKGSGAKVILGILIFLVISVTGVLGYMAIQGKGLPFNLGRKAQEWTCGPEHGACNGHTVSWSTCDSTGRWGCQDCHRNDLPADWCEGTTKKICSGGNVTSVANGCGGSGGTDCIAQKTYEGFNGLCLHQDGASVTVKATLPANCEHGGTRSITYSRVSANCSGASCAGTCGNAGETRTLTISDGQLTASEEVSCSVTNKCGNCQVDADTYGERAWQDSGCTVIPTNTPVPTNTPIPTATNTPIPTATATPVQPAPSCSSLTLSQSNITLGQSVTVSATISNYGSIRYGVCTSGTDCRVVDSQNPTTLDSGNSPVSKSFTPTAVGKYVFEVSAYDSSTCNSFCSPGTHWYKNTLAGGGGCDTAGHWADQGQGTCTSTGCIKFLTVTEAPVAPSCSSLTLSQSNITLGRSVTVSATISNYGLIRYGLCAGGTDCRVVDSQNPTTLEKSNSPVSKSFTPTAVGKYVFEVSAYDSSTCNSFCSAGTHWYKNTLAGGGGCDTAGHWADQGQGTCTSTGCIKWLTVIEAPPSPVCLDVTVVKKGTIGLDGLVPGDTIVITVTASGTVSDMAIRIKKDGVTLQELFSNSSWTPGTTWQQEYIIPVTNGAGSYEVQGFIKDGGVWK